MKLADLVLGEGHDLHAAKRHALEQAGNIFLIARQSVHRFGQHDLEATPAGIGDQRLDSRAKQRGSRDGMIGIFLDDLPTLLISMASAGAQLISDRRVALS
jgi:hypothetical protein